VLRMALDGELKLSVNILHGGSAKRSKCSIAELGEVLGKIPEAHWILAVLTAEDEICHFLLGVYDLPMIGGGRTSVSDKWQQLNDELKGEFINLVDTVIEGDDGHLYLLQEFKHKELPDDSDCVDSKNELTNGETNYGPVYGLPEDCVLGVRPSVLRELEDRIALEEDARVLAGKNTGKSENGKKIDPAEVLDPQHPWHSDNLALAINCWYEKYAKKMGSKNNKNDRPQKGHAKLIGEWVEKNRPEECRTSTTHFVAIVNPDKSGGAPKKPR